MWHYSLNSEIWTRNPLWWTCKRGLTFEEGLSGVSAATLRTDISEDSRATSATSGNSVLACIQMAGVYRSQCS
jgi:hypothetical protein